MLSVIKSSPYSSYASYAAVFFFDLDGAFCTENPLVPRLRRRQEVRPGLTSHTPSKRLDVPTAPRARQAPRVVRAASDTVRMATPRNDVTDLDLTWSPRVALRAQAFA